MAKDHTFTPAQGTPVRLDGPGEAKNVLRVWDYASCLTPREQWYLAEMIANHVGYSLIANDKDAPIFDDASQPPAAPVEAGMLGRENDAFHRTLRQYPEASKALHAFWNDAFAGQPQPDTHPGSSADSVEVPTDALINLVNYQEQCDEDGVMVKVSRQALAEVLVYVQMTRPDLNGVPQAPSTEETRQRVEDAIRTFCQSLGSHAIQMSHGKERIYYAGISLKALSVAATLAVTRPESK